MTFHILGIGILAPQGKTWSISPVLSGLQSAEGGLETGLGWFGVRWNVSDSMLTVAVSTPTGTSGTVKMPGVGPVTVDGRVEGEMDVELSGGEHLLSRHV
jgi:hypothetical protein